MGYHWHDRVTGNGQALYYRVRYSPQTYESRSFLDGDVVSIKGVYTIEANEELRNYMNTLTQYIGVDGINVRVSTNEAVQTIYNLTKVKEGSNLTKPIFKSR